MIRSWEVSQTQQTRGLFAHAISSSRKTFPLLYQAFLHVSTQISPPPEGPLLSAQGAHCHRLRSFADCPVEGLSGLPLLGQGWRVETPRGAQAPQEVLKKRLRGKGCHSNTRLHPLQGHQWGKRGSLTCKPTWLGLTCTPQRQATRIRVHRHTRSAIRWTCFRSQTARASARAIRSIPSLRPTRNQAPTMRTRGPESPPLACQGRDALGAGPAAPPGKLRESGRPPPHPPPSSPSSASEPSRAGAKPRAPRARAERVTESWRIRPASTVRTDGEQTGGRGSLLAAAAPPWLSGPSFLSRHQPGEASCFLLQPRVAWGGHFLVECGLTVLS